MNDVAAAETRTETQSPGPATESERPMVLFEEVQKSYDGESLVVKNLNLSIAKGEFLTMLGPSGSGKTTCLMMVAGFEAATHGEIYLGGRSTASRRTSAASAWCSRTTRCSRT